jgi:hypothetical protein
LEKMMRIRTTAALFTALGMALVGTGPASAEVTSAHDGADATASLNDMLGMRVDHGGERVTVRIRFTDLRRSSTAGPASIAIFLDTRGDRRGPEYRLGSGLQSGTDFQLMRARDWKPVGAPKTCPHDVDLQFARDRLVFTVARGCVGDPDRVRAGARMTDLFDGSHPVVDWIKKRRGWTARVVSD